MNFINIIFLALFVLVLNDGRAQTSSESCAPQYFGFEGPSENTLCAQYGDVTFDISVGIGTIYQNSSQLPLLPPNPNILVVGDFNVNTALIWEGATIKINPGVSINITTANISMPSSLKLDDCKLFACIGLWKGIIMNNHTIVQTTNGTHIEDAEGAIQAINTFNTSLFIENTTLNRNKKGIVLHNDVIMPKSPVVYKLALLHESCWRV